MGPLFSTPTSTIKGKNGVITYTSPADMVSQNATINCMKSIGEWKVHETLSETSDMGANKKVYEDQLK